MEKYISEDYCSEEITGLLQDKGYVGSINTYLDKDGFRVKEITIQSAMKWLRETFEIHCQIDCPIAASNWVYGIRNLNQDEWVTLRNMGDYDTYEEACEAAIKYCLENLI